MTLDLRAEFERLEPGAEDERRLFFISDGETNAERLEALETEVANKEKARATIGFA